MERKIFTNHTLVTKSWGNAMFKVIVVLGGVIAIFPLLALFGVSLAIWFVSLGHVNFCGILYDTLDKFGKYVDSVVYGINMGKEV